MKSSSKPTRTLAILAVVLIAFGGLAFFQNDTIKLGLDLRGGTSVTLQPRVAAGGTVSTTSINQAVAIIRQRVNSLGVAESQVTAQGSGNNQQIVISVPGETGARIVDLVGQTAELRFRQVLAAGAGNAATTQLNTATTTKTTTDKKGVKKTATPAAVTPIFPTGVSPALNAQFGALDCTKASNRQGGNIDQPDAPIVSCSRDGGTKYVLAPASVLGSDVSKASATLDQNGGSGWMVLLNFNGNGTTKFGKITTSINKLAAPQNDLAIVLDGLVISAPRILGPINGGSANITGSFTQTDASDLANVL